MLLAAGIPAIGMGKSQESENQDLLAAVRVGNYDAVKNTLEANANPNIADDLGYTPLIFAVFTGNPELVKILILHGADVNARGKQTGSTALFYVINIKANMQHMKLVEKENKYKEIIKLLLYAGADPNIKNNPGATALDYADPETKKFIENILKNEIAMR